VPAVPITISHSRFGATGQIQLPCTAGQPYRYRIFLRLVFLLVFLRLLTQNRREFLPPPVLFLSFRQQASFTESLDRSACVHPS
jgi:hypothetical protein